MKPDERNPDRVVRRLIAKYAPQYAGDDMFFKQVRGWVEADFLVWLDKCEYYRRIRGTL